MNELKELDEEADEDDEFFAEYRKKRLMEMQAKAQKEVYGVVRQITQTEYKSVVESKGAWVVVHLFRETLPLCQLMNQFLEVLARKFRATNFVKIYTNEAIQDTHYPDKNLPTLLIYHNGEMTTQLVGKGSFGIRKDDGDGWEADDLEWALKHTGAIESDLEENPRLTKKNKNSNGGTNNAFRDRMNYIGHLTKD